MEIVQIVPFAVIVQLEHLLATNGTTGDKPVLLGLGVPVLLGLGVPVLYHLHFKKSKQSDLISVNSENGNERYCCG